MSGSWQHVVGVAGRSYTCGYCGQSVGPSVGYFRDGSTDFILICPTCAGPTVFFDDNQHPGVPSGASVQGLPDDVSSLYGQARRCIAASAYTGAVLICRKILMHVAVTVGADPGKNFVDYVQYLLDERHVPANAKGWVDHIRTEGNEENHEIDIATRAEAEQLIAFTEMLLKLMYEMPTRVPGATLPSGNAGGN
jgi:hypothetical protein